jgi:acyl-CoA synthetase (AMP-forming)/AMP-acid ligase II
VNIAMLLDLVADTFGDRVALTESGESRTYDQLRGLARAAAGELSAAGAATLAYADVSSSAVPTALFGAAWAGASYAPLNFRLPADSLRQQVARLDRPAVVSSTALVAELTEPPATERAVWLERLGRDAGSRDAVGEYVADPEGLRSSCSPAARRAPRRPHSSATTI